MKKHEQSEDPFLEQLIHLSTQEEIPAGFTSSVMTKIEALPAYTPKKTSLLRLLKCIVPWIALFLCVVIVLIVSGVMDPDHFIVGKLYPETLYPTIEQSFNRFFALFSSKTIVIMLAIAFSGIGFFLFERLIAHRQTHRYSPMF